jgi:hypothetical protein
LRAVVANADGAGDGAEESDEEGADWGDATEDKNHPNWDLKVSGCASFWACRGRRTTFGVGPDDQRGRVVRYIGHLAESGEFGGPGGRADGCSAESKNVVEDGRMVERCT